MTTYIVTYILGALAGAVAVCVWAVCQNDKHDGGDDEKWKK